MGRRSRGRADQRVRRLLVEPLEPRLLLSAATPTNYDQYLLELVNRGRANPAAEAARYGISLNEGLDPGTISTDPKQPLALNPYLLDGARLHTQWMINQDTLAHTGAGGSDPGDRMAAAGYGFVPPWGWGENLAMFRQTPTVPPMGTGTEQLHRNLFVDSGVDGRGHRLNLMDADFKEVGTAVLAGDWGGWNAVVCTEDFAYSGGGSFLTGVTYDDQVTQDSFYTPGEGLGGVSIVATRLSDQAQFTAATWTSGGYSLALPAGTYDVAASGGSLAGTATVHNIVIGQLNVKQDFTPAMVQTPPDLQVTVLTAPDTTAGSTLAVDTTVRNAGGQATGSGFTVSYYLSTNALWDAGDTLLAATGNARSALAAGSNDAFSAQVTLPQGNTGSLYLIAYADWNGSAGSVAESNEANNTRADALAIQAPPAPDLQVTALTAPDTTAGSTIAVDTTVRNAGGQATGSGFTVSYYLSTNALWDAGDALLAATGNARSALAAGGNDAFSAQVTLPQGTTGSLYLIAYADWNGSAGAVAESNEANNARADALAIQPAPTLADLQVTSITTPDATAGSTVAVDTTVRNAGGQATGSGFTVSYYLSTNALWDAGDTLLGATGNTRPALAAGSNDAFSAQVTLPQGTTGSLFLIAYADWDGAAGAVAESNEANNTRADALAVQAPPVPDLQVTALAAPDAAEGSTVTIATTVRNAGGQATGSGFTVSYYLSADAQWDAGDTLLTTTGNARSALGAGSNDAFSAQVTLPQGTTGSLYLIAYADWDGAAGAVAESNEANNTRADALTLRAPTPPDLQATALAAPDAVADTTIAVATTVRNTGDLATGAGFTVSYYLSSNAQWDAADTLLAATGNARSALAGGSNDTFFAQVTLPHDAAGSLFLIAYVDWDGAAGAVAETNEANNTRPDALTIQSVGLLEAPWPADPSAVLIGQAFTFDFSATCEGLPGAAYSLVSGPSWIAMDAQTGILSGTPSRRTDIGSAPVTIQVDDGLGASNSYTFQVNVQGQVISVAAGTRATFIDATNDRATVSLAGRSGTLYLVRAIAPDTNGVYSLATPGDLYAMEAEGTGAGTAISFTATPTVRGQAARSTVGNILVTGSLTSFTAPMVDLRGDLTVTGGLGRLTLGNVGDGSAGASPSLAIGSDPAILATALTFGQVRDAAINSVTPIKSLAATEWLDPTGPQDQIVAPSLGTLTIKGRQGAIRGDFEADLELSGSSNPLQPTLGSATIAGQLTSGAWAIDGDAGRIRAAAVRSGWSLDATGIVKSLEATASLAGTIQAKAISKVTTNGGLNAAIVLTGDDGKGVSLGTLKAGAAGNATVAAPKGITSINVVSWQGGSISAAWIGTLSAAGNARLGLPGDFGADLSLSAAGNPRQTLGRASIGGTLTDALWTVSGVVGTLDVGRWGPGSIVAVGVGPGNDGVYLGTDDEITGGRVDSLTIRLFGSSPGPAFGLTAAELNRITLVGQRLALADLPLSQGDFRIILAADALHKGVALPLWNETLDIAQLRTTLDHLKALGVNWVEINVFWFQDNATSATIAPNFALYSASDASVRTVIDEVHRRGMKVMLKPIVDLASDPDHWRGDIPGSDAWFTGAQGYDAFIAHWAGIASEKGAEMLCIGTELSTASAKEAQWRTLIANVRAAYTGQLTYAANQGGATQVTWESIAWWDALDFIGLDAYYPLTNKTDPTQAEMDAAWAAKAAMIETWHTGLDAADQRPILFTEAGCRSWDGANIDPSNQTEAGNTNIDQQEQAGYYSALFNALWGQKSWFTGVFWWNWEVDPSPTWVAPNWWTPQGKLAEEVIRLHYT